MAFSVHPLRSISLGRDVCSTAGVLDREWLVTNGLGGYAAGTLAGSLSRRYHGLLIAALEPPLKRTLLLSKLEETVVYDGRRYLLYTNHHPGERLNDEISPVGYIHLLRFHLEGTTPVWTYAIADALLEKRVWMEHGANTTYITYRLVRASLPLQLTLNALVNCRGHHINAHRARWSFSVTDRESRLLLTGPHGIQFFLFVPQAVITHTGVWFRDFFMPVEHYRGLDALDDHYHVADFAYELFPGEEIGIVASTDSSPDLDFTRTYLRRQEYERALLSQANLPAVEATTVSAGSTSPRLHPVAQLVLAADQFIVRRSTSQNPHGKTVIAGYPWFTDWGRDTMIALPGLTLAVGRPQIARDILETFARYVDQGMLPNRFPSADLPPEYNTVDATLWFFQAIAAYFTATSDLEFLNRVYPVLEEIIDWHMRGTRYHIRVDPADGLLYAGEPGVQLTWMDAKVEDWVVTPRIGKPVEINALWYNALLSQSFFARALGKDPSPFTVAAETVSQSFSRFWSPELGYCYDVIDGPQGYDASLRPNQLFAISLPFSPLDAFQQKSIVDLCSRKLFTHVGLRSLSPDDPQYVGIYGGHQRQRDAAYHQGTVWGWLIGPYISAFLRVYPDPQRVLEWFEPLFEHLSAHAVGTISENFSGDPPFTPRACFAQAWSVAEVLRCWRQVHLMLSESGANKN